MAVWLGVDVGTVRVGVAKSDATGLLASPLTVIRRDRSGADVADLAALAQEWEARGVVVGLPVTLRGREGDSARMAREFAAALQTAASARAHTLAIEFVDERNTTVSAQRDLRAAGVKARDQRDRIDAHAAAVLLQLWLDRARSVPATTPEVRS